jgi:hypothetical protein
MSIAALTDMEKFSDLVSQRQPPKPTRQTERGDLYDTMLSRLNPSRVRGGYKPLTHGRLAYLLTGIPTKDLYALISKCSDAERRGFPWSAIFWKEIRPQKP